jgi:hypothetical protein
VAIFNDYLLERHTVTLTICSDTTQDTMGHLWVEITVSGIKERKNIRHGWRLYATNPGVRGMNDEYLAYIACD